MPSLSTLGQRQIEVGEVINDNAVKIGNWVSGSDEWHAARAMAIGGSEVSAIVGLNPWESRYSLYYRKRDMLRPIELNGAMEWGTRNEPAIFEKYAEGLEPGLTMTTGDTFRDLNRPWMNVNPDGLVWDANGNLIRILEIKTSAYGTGFGRSGTNKIPIYYLCQVLYYASVMRCKSIQVAVLIGGNDYRVFNITYSEEDAQFLIDAGQQFMDDLANNVEPNLTSDMATYEAVRELNPLIEYDAEIELDDEVALPYIAAKQNLIAVKDELYLREAEVLKLAGTARQVWYDGEVIARRQMPGRGTVPYLRYIGPEKEHPTSVLEAVKAA